MVFAGRFPGKEQCFLYRQTQLITRMHESRRRIGIRPQTQWFRMPRGRDAALQAALNCRAKPAGHRI